MNFKSKFLVGDKVTIFQNTERTIKAARLGQSGVVTNNLMRDIEILLNGESNPVRILEDDIKLVTK